MKTKLLLIPAILLLITGCSSSADLYGSNNQTTTPENSQPTTMQTTPETSLSFEAGQAENLSAQYKSAILKTSMGDVKVELYGSDSPKTVNNFLYLAKQGYFNGTLFHRVIKDFMIQGGDTNSKSSDWSIHGTGGPGYAFADEFNSHKLVRGSLAMANSGPNTNGSQFFIVTAASTPWLDGKHVNFGQVTEGMDIVSKIEDVKTNQNDHPLEDVKINSIELIK